MATGQQQGSSPQQGADTVFLYLKLIMTEAPISVKELEAQSGIASATIGRARSGKPLKRNTQVALFDAVTARPKCAFLATLRGRLLINKSAARADPTLEAALMAGFNN